MAAKYKKNLIPISDSASLTVYATPDISTALGVVMDDITLWKAGKLQQVIEAVYTQGRKDGANDTLQSVEESVGEVRGKLGQLKPGRPKKKKKKK